MGKTRPRNPKKPTVASSSHGSKAPGLPRAKKKKRDIVHLGDDGEHSGTHDKQRTKDEQNEHNAPNKKKEARKKRSVLGFVVGASACLAIWGWAVVQGITKRKRDHDILAKMSRRPLVLTDHASCRMDCRFISTKHIKHALSHGSINDRKSEPNLRPCPKYVVDDTSEVRGKTPKSVQVVFSACPTETRVLTVIDTKTNWPCGPC